MSEDAAIEQMKREDGPEFWAGVRWTVETMLEIDLTGADRYHTALERIKEICISRLRSNDTHGDNAAYREVVQTVLREARKGLKK